MASSSLKSINPNAEIMNKQAALFMNINAAKGLQDVMKSNLGPKGTIKMLVGGAGGAFSRHPLLPCSLQQPPHRRGIVSCVFARVHWRDRSPVNLHVWLEDDLDG
jgi:hypothetical protein